MKIIFMGTPDFAVYSLKALLDNHEISAVVTQPDKPRGRGKRVSFCPVKEIAADNKIPVIQPEKIKSKGFYNQVKSYNADIFVVVAYGRMLPEVILQMPKYGAVNVHASLLPKYRGAAPIQWAIINGENKTGITIMQMDKGIDTGDMILKKEIPITGLDTGGSLHDKLARTGAQALLEALALIEKGEASWEAQDDSLASYAPMINKDTGCINWNKNTDEIINLVRALNPWPGAYTMHNETQLKIFSAAEYKGAFGKPGELSISDSKELIIKTGDTGLLLKEVQRPGGKKMGSAAFLRGNRLS